MPITPCFFWSSIRINNLLVADFESSLFIFLSFQTSFKLTQYFSLYSIILIWRLAVLIKKYKSVGLRYEFRVYSEIYLFTRSPFSGQRYDLIYSDSKYFKKYLKGTLPSTKKSSLTTDIRTFIAKVHRTFQAQFSRIQVSAKSD